MEDQSTPIEQQPQAAAQPVEPAPQAEPAAQTEAPSQTEVNEAPPVAEQQPTEPASSTTSEVVEEDSTEANEEQLPPWQPNQVDLNQLPRDPENPDYVDPQAYAQLIQQQAVEAARREVAEQRHEEKLWDKAEEAYPDLKTNKDLRDLVHNSRMGEILVGKNPSPKQIADRFFKQLGTAKKQGVEQAQTNVEVQQSARLETSNTSSQTSPTNRGNLLTQVGSYDAHTRDAAVDALLKDMFDSGDLKLPQL